MKQKIKLLLSILVLLILVVGCVPQEEDPTSASPVIYGAVDKTIERGSVFIPLDGITADDVEDGDLTGQIVYSGNVNPNVVGTYQATYSVTDSDGNLTTVTITITVVLVDTEAPLLSGVADVTISLGDPNFSILGGVSANDTVDGELTSNITTSGNVNVWVPGEYTVTYTVSDAAGNQAQRERKITVSLGYFMFIEDNVLLNGLFETDVTHWAFIDVTPVLEDGILNLDLSENAYAKEIEQGGLSGGIVNPDVANFILAKLVITAKGDANQSVHAIIDQATTTASPIVLTSEMIEHVQYFRMTTPLDQASLELSFGTQSGLVEIDSIALYIGVSSDTEAPVLNVPTTDVYAPVNNLTALRSLVLRGVSAIDNIDGNITSSLILDLNEIDLTVAGTVMVPIIARDSAGNETIVHRTVHLNYAFDTHAILDPGFDHDLDTVQWGLSGGSDLVTLYTEDGQMVIDIVSPGGWDSATSPFLRNITTNQLLPGNYYMFQFDVKAEKNRQLRLRSGLELWSDPWIEDFQDGAVRNLQYQITTEWQTIYYVFYVESATSAAGSNVVKFEIKVGTITWGSEESNNKIFIDNAQFYLLSTTDEAPEISLVDSKPLTFAVGSDAPDWKSYFTIFDKEDGVIEVTDAMIDASAIMMNVSGTYDLIITVTDTGGNEVSLTQPITILSEADVTPPVLTQNPDLPTTFNQFENVVVDLRTYVTATDNVDGDIAITLAMISNGGFTLNLAGIYTVTYIVPDSSGNTTTLSIEFIVIDTQAPVISGAKNQTITFGQVFDPLDGITVIDNVDGPIVLTLDHVSGYDAFLDENMVAFTAGVFELTYTVSDALNNEVVLVIEITVLNVDFDASLETDLLGLKLPVQNDSGMIESVGVYQPDGSLEVTYNGVEGWYGSYSKITYPTVNLLQDRLYKLVIEAKADVPRDVLVRFVGANDTAVTAFVNRLVVPLSDEFAVYELIFSLDQTGPYNIQLQFGWEGHVSGSDIANVMTFKTFKLVPELVIDYDLENAANLLGLETPVGNDGGVESVGVYQPDGSLIVTYNGATGWYGSYSKITYYQSVTEGLHYKILLEAKADSPRDILIRFVDGDGIVVPGFENRIIVSLTDTFQIIEIDFVAPNTGTYNLQLQFGWEDFLNNASNANVMTFNQFLLISEKVIVPVEEKILMLDDFEGYADQTAMEVVYTHRVSSSNHNDAHISLGAFGADGSQGIQFMFGEHSVTGWDLVRTKHNITPTGVTNEYLYFAFWYKGDPSITTVFVWLYWSGSQNSQAVDVSGVPAEGGHVYVAISSYGKTATDITQYAIGFNMANTTTKGVIFIDEIMFITNPTVLEN